MIDKDKFLEGLKELYDKRETKSDLYGSILWHLAKGTWKVEDKVWRGEERELTCMDCKRYKHRIMLDFATCSIHGMVGCRKDICSEFLENFPPFEVKKRCQTCRHHCRQPSSPICNYCNKVKKVVDEFHYCSGWEISAYY